jgi:CRP-like cAMP-binding protein
MTIEDDIAFLERLPILRRLGAPALRILAIGVESYSVAAGDTLFAAGDVADCAYVIRQGAVMLYPAGGNEGGMIADAGMLLGESALLTETRRPVTAVARDNVIVLRISRAMFLKVLESFPDAAARLRELIAGRTNEWEQELENIRSTLLRGD